ncbi:TRAP transporter small permease [Breoghania sp. L-A4]|uniref:TRAP transporter small permease n=1 Tax=Breoghania sp. L-A4 TaxID=2304600 RepID=UPI000E358404|nr:TRAP transporter small permease [Breoghania sp. L-A4]AXS41590.1 TRAP transporter small permease [Breoghania sp. L-A4]
MRLTESPGAEGAGDDGPAWLAGVDRVLDRIARLCMTVAGVMLVFLIVIFGWLVFGRYVLNNTPTWVEQASLLIVVFITFLGAPVGIRQKTHLSIDFVREAMPGPIRVATYYISDVLLILFGGFMAWQGAALVDKMLNRMIPMIGLSEGWRAAPMVICGVFLILFAGADILTRLLRRTPAGN